MRAIEQLPAGEALKRMDQLGRCRLSFVIRYYQVRDVTLADGRQADAFDWITFKGDACVPKE